jgi:WASH complex subunit 7
VQPHERLEIFSLFRSSDPSFNKVCTVLAALVEEVEFLLHTAEAKFYAQLSLFGHSKHDDGDEFGDGILEAMMGRSVPLFQDTANYVARLSAVVLNLVRQLQALFGRGSGFAGGFREVKLKPVVVALGDALTVLATLDAVVTGNRVIAAAWEKYKRLADVMRADPARYGVDAAKAEAFDRLLGELDASVLSGSMLRRCLDQQFEAGAGGDREGAYRDWLRDRALENVDSLVAALGGDLETTERHQLVGQLHVYGLYRALAGGRVPAEVLKKQLERLWRVTEAVPLVQLHGRYAWQPDRFLAAYCAVPGVQLSKLVPKNPDAVRAAAADASEAGLAGAVNVLHARVTAWLIKADMALADHPLVTRQPPMDIVRARAILLNQAICLAYGANRTVTTFLLFQLSLGRDFKRKCIEPLARACELLKVLEGAVRAHAAALAETVTHVHRDNVIAIMDLFLPLRLKASAAKKSDDALKYVAAATELVQWLCTGTESWTKLRRIALEIGLSVGLQKAAIAKDSEVGEIVRSAWQLSLLADYQVHMRRACDCGLLYWVRELLPSMVAAVCTTSGAAPADGDSRHGARLQYLFTAFSDPAKALALAVHLPPPPHAARRLVPDDDALVVVAGGGGAGGGAGGGGAGGGAGGAGGAAPTAKHPLADIEHVLTAYERYLHGIISHDLIQPLVRAVETDLRVTVHAVHLSHMEPPSLKAGRPPLVHLLALPPLRVVGALVDIKAEVTFALEKTFYELTTVALHDWKT